MAQSILALALCVVASLVRPASAAEPTAEPVIRIETGTHTAKIARLGVDRANRYLVTASADRTARVWDLASGRLERILRPPIGAGNEGRIDSVAISPDGSTVVCGGWTGWDWDKVHSIYFFDRARGQLLRRVSGMKDIVIDLAWSADGSLVAAGLAVGGIRVVRAQDGAEVGSDAAYGDRVNSVDFHANGKLVTTSYDGFLRTYRVSGAGLTLLEKQAAAGKRPYKAQISPDGTKIAVGYLDIARVDVLSADTLGLLYSPEMQGVRADHELSSVAWSADGRQLWAGGTHRSKTIHMLRVWAESGRGAFTDLPATTNTVHDLAPLTAGGVVYSSSAPGFGAFDASGRKILEQRGGIADFRDNQAAFKVSRDGTTVQFGFEIFGKPAARFDLGDRRLTLDPPADTSLVAAVTTAPGLDIQGALNTYRPTLNGQEIKLQPYERSRGVAIPPDQQGFVIGTEWHLRRFDRQGKAVWSVPVPAVAWAVNVSGDGKTVVTLLGDGTIRWYRIGDGRELMALFPHADRTRWVVWSPSGYYDASPGGEDLIGWHLNRGKETAADFYPASRFRGVFYRPDVVARVLDLGDETAALKRADENAGRQTQAIELARTLPPVVEIVGPVDGTAVSTGDVRVRFTVRTVAGAPLTGLRARVNGQPVNVPEAAALVAQGASGGPREVSIPVPPQDAEIALFAENRHGVSVPAIVRVTWHGATGGGATAAGSFVVKPKLYVLAVGVSQYQNAEWKLQYPAKDARDFAGAMLAQRGGLYRDVEIKVLVDAQATRDEVVDGLEWLQRQVTAKDVGMLFLAGHGVNDTTGNYYYLPVNADVERLKRTGVPFAEIRNTLSNLAGKALFFVDTCHSGNVMGAARRAGPVDIVAVVNELSSAENGVVVLASSTGRQYSLESPVWKNGAFTKALVEGVTGQADLRKTGLITHKMLDFYISERVKELTKGQQTPVNPSPQGVPDFPIALVSRSGR